MSCVACSRTDAGVALQKMSIRTRWTIFVLTGMATFTLGVLAARLHVQPFATHRSCYRRQPECSEWEKARFVRQGLGWDLTYTSLLRNSGVCPGDVYCAILAVKPQPPVHRYFAEWKGDPIISSILFESPEGSAAVNGSWIIRTKDRAYFFSLHPDPALDGPLSVRPEEYDRAFETLKCWEQYQPSNQKFYGGHETDGYIGFLSLYKDGRSRQMLLTTKDILLYHPQDGNYLDRSIWGRLGKTLIPITESVREQREQATHHP